jgi:putative hydrolase of the HAD superfamily
MKEYKHIFFDLDHTLWDYERNANETLNELFEEFELANKKVVLSSFFEMYRVVNASLWRKYNSGKITKDGLRETRFYQTLGTLGLNDRNLALTMEDRFLELCPTKPHILPNTIEILEYLKGKYQLHIITNGFKGSSEDKLRSSGILHYFIEVVTSECFQSIKPSPGIFEYALKKSNAVLKESVMIGDNLETDIQGAKNVGMDHIYYNPHRRSHKESIQIEISDLIELQDHL